MHYQGVQYLHRSALSVHGRLNSSNCLIDSRFVLKLTDFGLHTLREGATEAHGCHAVMTSKYVYMLVLRSRMV